MIQYFSIFFFRNFCTVAELIGVHSNFLKLEVAIFYAKFKDSNYAYNLYLHVWIVCIYVVIFRLRINDNVFSILKIST